MRGISVTMIWGLFASRVEFFDGNSILAGITSLPHRLVRRVFEENNNETAYFPD